MQNANLHEVGYRLPSPKRLILQVTGSLCGYKAVL